MIPGELLDDPVTAETTDAAVLFPTERPSSCVVDAVIVDVRHACFNAKS